MPEEISARMPHPAESRYLHLQPGMPVLDVWRTSFDQDGEPYELTRFVMRGDMTRPVLQRASRIRSGQ
jgi:GntR family transcriptional regulator